MYRIVNFSIQPEAESATVASLHFNLTMSHASFIIHVVYYSVIRDSAVIN